MVSSKVKGHAAAPHIILYSLIQQNLEELVGLLELAVSEVTTLMVTLLQKEFSSDNLESIFKVRTDAIRLPCICRT